MSYPAMCTIFCYSNHTTYTKMCRCLLIHKMLVPSHYIRAYLWCHNIPNHCDVTGSSMTSSYPLFVADVVMTSLLTSITTTKCSWQWMTDPCIVGICTSIWHDIIANSWDNEPKAINTWISKIMILNPSITIPLCKTFTK